MVRLVAAVALWLAVPWDTAVLEAVMQGSPALRLSPGGISMGGKDWRSKLEEVRRLAAAASAAKIIASKLAKIEAEFRERRQRLTVVSAGTESEAYRAKEVESLVDSTEKKVLDALDGKDLAALRDSVRLRFRRIRQDLNAGAQSGWLHEQDGIRLAAFGRNRAGLQGLLLRALAEPLLEIAGNTLKTLKSLADENRFTLRLCVISKPEPNASFRMWPQEYKKGDLGTETNGEIPRAGIGRYFYKIEYKQRALKRQFEPIQCSGEDESCLDFLQKSGDQLIDCDFATGSCHPSDLPSGTCPPPPR